MKYLIGSLIILGLFFSSCKEESADEPTPAKSCKLERRVETSSSVEWIYDYTWEENNIINIVKKNDLGDVFDEFNFIYDADLLKRITSNSTTVNLIFNSGSLDKIDYYDAQSNTFIYFDSLNYENGNLLSVSYYEKQNNNLVNGGIHSFEWLDNNVSTYRLYEDINSSGTPELIYTLNFTKYDQNINPYSDLPLAWKVWRLIYDQPWLLSKNNVLEGEEVDGAQTTSFQVLTSYNSNGLVEETDDVDQDVLNKYIYTCK